MDYELTPGAQRALVEATGWTSRAESDELEAPALLLGLLAESECRAAIILSRHRVDTEKVLRNWPHRAPARRPATDPPQQEDDSAAIETAYLCALNRYPSEAETCHFIERLSDSTNRGEAIEDLIWVLLNSSELAWNH